MGKRTLLRGLVVLLAALVGCSDDSGPPGTDGPGLLDSQQADTSVWLDTRAADARIGEGTPGEGGLHGDAAAFPKCTTLGGICRQHHWEICPVNMEPVYPDPHQDCGAGLCCVQAPASTCSSSGSANCFYGSACTGCWASPRNASLTCEAGRVCCENICDGP